MRIGFIFNHIVPTKVAAKRNRLIQNCQGLILGAEKFSVLHNNKVAAANRPTTTGRRPAKTDCTTGVFRYLRNILLIRIIIINDGSTRAMVAVRLPNTAIPAPKPALCTAV